MKPDGRSLDIVVIGLGQAGGNIATEFFRRGYPSLALNTAESDLAALEPGGVVPPLPSDRRLYIGIDGYDGAGADPGYGSECVHEHAEQVREAVLAHAQDADAIILAAGLGGGTGSSLASLVTVLAELELPLVGLVTLPSDGESGIHKVNAVRAINELVDASLQGWIFIDNARLGELHRDVAVVDYFAHINSEIAAPIDALNRLNNRADLRSIRSFDGEDLRKLLLSGGVLNYGVTQVPIVTEDSVMDAIRDGLAASRLMPAGFEMDSVSYLGLVVEATEAGLARTPIAVFEHIDEHIKRETGGAAVYRGLYRATSAQSPVTLRFLAACQGLPHRIREILTDARKEGLAIRDKLQVELPMLELGEIERIELFRGGAKNPASERPKKRRTQAPELAPGIEELRQDIMRPRRPAQSPQIKRQAKVVRGSSGVAPMGNEPSNPAASPAIPTEHERPSSNTLPSPASLRRSKPAGVSAAPPPPPPPRPTAPARTGLKRPQSPLEMPVAASAHEPVHELITHEFDVEAELGKQREAKLTPVIERLLSEESPKPETYDRLVADYLHTTAVEERDRIADRLEADSQSEQTVIRYYAVEAMSKLGRSAFEQALTAAAEDQNEAVRAIALEALRR